MGWIKYTFGGFFKNEISKEGVNKSYVNILFALFFAILLLTTFVSIGYSASYSTHYKQSSGFKDFAYSLFLDEENSNRLNLTVNNVNEEDEYASINVYRYLDNKDSVIINTFDNESDKAKYSKYGYNLVVDTRDSDTTFVEFKVKYVEKDNPENEVSADVYRENKDNGKYQGSAEIYNTLVTISDEQALSYLNWLDDHVSILNEQQATEFAQLISLDRTSNAFKELAYSLYTRVYYSMAYTPTIINYYQNTFASLDEKGQYKYHNFMLLTDQWAIISFNSDNGVQLIFDGYYTSLPDKFSIYIEHSQNMQDVIKENVDTFIHSIFSSVTSVKSLYTAVAIFRFLPYILIAILLLSLMLFLFCKAKNIEYGIRFLPNIKIISNYLIMGSIISGVVAFILSFFINNNNAYLISVWGLLVVIFIRTLLLIILDKTKKENTEKQKEAIDISDIM